MTTIPERIREEARKTLDGMAVAFNGTGGFKVLQERIAQALLAAEKLGREEAAKIAERDVDWTRFGKGEVHEPWENGPDDARDYRVGIVAGRSIAAAIRSTN